MATDMVRCTYENLIPVKRIPYWVFWPSIGIAAFGVTEGVLLWLHEAPYRWTVLILAGGGIGGLPTAYTWLSRSFQSTVAKLGPILWEDPQESNDWLQTSASRYFTFKYLPAKLVTGFVVVLAYLTILAVGLPLKTATGNIIVLIGFLPLAAVCGQGAHGLMSAIVALNELARRPTKAPFFMLPHPAVTGLHRYYSRLGLIVAIAYGSLFTAIWYGPYGLVPLMILWLFALAIYPAATFVASLVFVHELMKRIKMSQIAIINQEIQNTWQQPDTRTKAAELDKLDKLMRIQERLQTMREWPIAIESGPVVLSSLATLAGQAMLLIPETMLRS